MPRMFIESEGGGGRASDLREKEVKKEEKKCVDY
jgi:hypothetical protein